MKPTLFFIVLLLGYFSYAQKPKFYFENKEDGVILYADNIEMYPVSILLTTNLTNMSFSEGMKNVFVLPLKSMKIKIGEFTIKQKGMKYNCSYQYKSEMGDVTIKDYDKNFEYDLPFQQGKTYQVFQGYNGSFSHKNENAIDFVMPIGTEILATREGVVVKIEQDNTESCIKEECKKYNNYITVMHSDGTFASYVHIKFKGAKVNVGDSVKKGDVIGYSGNVGWSSGPHLHFVCFKANFDNRVTLETKFRINKGNTSAILQEKISYTRDY